MKKKLKQCKDCKKNKPLSNFYKREHMKDGLFGICKECSKKYSYKWRKENRKKHLEYRKEYNKKWWDKNKDRLNRIRKEFRQNHVEKFREMNKLASRKWRKKNPEQSKENTRNYRINNLEKVKAKRKKWAKNNPQKDLFYVKRRRARKMNADGSHTLKEWELLKKDYNYQCPLCKKFEPEVKLTEDHIVPLSKGGSDYLNNIQPLCKRCNSIKYNKIIPLSKLKELCIIKMI